MPSNPNVMPRTLRIICAWCRTILAEGREPASHGICAPCAIELRRVHLGEVAHAGG